VNQSKNDLVMYYDQNPQDMTLEEARLAGALCGVLVMALLTAGR